MKKFNQSTPKKKSNYFTNHPVSCYFMVQKCLQGFLSYHFVGLLLIHRLIYFTIKTSTLTLQIIKKITFKAVDFYWSKSIQSFLPEVFMVGNAAALDG